MGSQSQDPEPSAALASTLNFIIRACGLTDRTCTSQCRCLKYSFDHSDILTNFIRCTVPLRLCYPPSWWRPFFLKRAEAMGVLDLLDLLQAALLVSLPHLPGSVSKRLFTQGHKPHVD